MITQPSPEKENNRTVNDDLKKSVALGAVQMTKEAQHERIKQLKAEQEQIERELMQSQVS